ncbi:MAG: CRTAC1 family protein, partial [Thermoanaerobaculia bacterium]|nr:CRTAC1 family protein [Thermoanaerobaculia bacterium]
YRNRGDGSFEDVTVAVGLSAEVGNGLGVTTGDFDGDGRIDLYVANDLTPNHLWLNRGGRFESAGLASGSALNADGQAEASMGVDAADLDADGDLDLFMTHFSRETNTVYLNDGTGFFMDSTEMAGLGTPSWKYTAFGTGFLDYDLDGWLDLVVVNGAVVFPPGTDREATPYPLDEPNQLFRNLDGSRFQDVSAAAGPAFALSEVSRGAVLGDIDNDGDTDVVVTNNSGPTRVLRNEADVAAPWVGARAVTRGRDALGALVWADTAGPAGAIRPIRTDGSYASARDPRVAIALGRGFAARRVALVVRWPSGARERFEGLALGRYHTLVEGRGAPASR